MAKLYQPGDLDEDQILEKLLRYCDYQERCRYDVIRKLKILGVTEKDQKQNFISKLEETGYLNEERFIKSFIRGKYRIKKWGLKRIEKELKYRNIPNELFSRELESLNDEKYLEQFEQIAQSKWEKIKGKNPFEKKGKLFKFLYNKGYESDMIKEFLSKH